MPGCALFRGRRGPPNKASHSSAHARLASITGQGWRGRSSLRPCTHKSRLSGDRWLKSAKAPTRSLAALKPPRSGTWPSLIRARTYESGVNDPIRIWNAIVPPPYNCDEIPGYRFVTCRRRQTSLPIWPIHQVEKGGCHVQSSELTEGVFRARSHSASSKSRTGARYPSKCGTRRWHKARHADEPDRPVVVRALHLQC